MFEFDVKEIEKKLEEEYPTSTSINLLAQSMLNYHPELHDVIEYWLRGEYLNFEYEEISLKEIVDRTECGFIDAVTRMNILLKGKISAKNFKQNMERFFTTDIVCSDKGLRKVIQRRNYKWL